ncbi:MAG: TonB-dependent receptor, partial [Planctomycetales bacterium]|nr:TonB-dependent receptor [Planctomycetales bacterium]
MGCKYRLTLAMVWAGMPWLLFVDAAFAKDGTPRAIEPSYRVASHLSSAAPDDALPSDDANSEGGTQDADAETDSDEKKEKDLPGDLNDLLDMDIEQLSRTSVGTQGESILDDVVSTVSRTDTSVRHTPSAVYVVTQDMIKRSGARNVMEVLRTVPGLHVARINAHTWAISIRGFNGGYTDKLLVQIDGRAIYTAVFSGTFWELQLIPLKDIDRIEVVRGPGATAWGANAVNGVINIVTKDSADTVGLYAEAGGGSEHRSFSHGRAGGTLGNRATYRVYGTHVEDDAGLDLGAGVNDARRGAQAGFRMDWRPSDCDVATLQGDFANIEYGDDTERLDGNFLARWSRQVDRDVDWMIQTYYSNNKGAFPPDSTLISSVGQNVFDLDAQRHTRHDRHDVVCGFGFRSYETYLHTLPGQTVDLTPDSRAFDTISYFAQDTLTLQDDLLFLTLGCRCEHNDFVGFVYQPAAKIAVTPEDHISLWGSVSRAMRTPAVTNRDITIQSPFGGGQTLRLNGSRTLRAEEAISYELGCRHQTTERFYSEVSVYFTRYNDLIRGAIIGFTPPFVDGTSLNSGTADTYGFEYWGTYESTDWQRWRGSYSFYRIVLKDFAFPVIDYTNAADSFPRNMVSLTSSTDVSERVTFDSTLRYVDAISSIDAYLEMDMRLGWALSDQMEFSLVGQNLL